MSGLSVYLDSARHTRRKRRRPHAGRLKEQLVAKFFGWIAGLSVFGVWMNIVGNPHVVETVIGLVFAFVAGFWVFFKLRKFATKRNDSK